MSMDFPGHFKHIFQQLNHQRIHGQLCDCLVSVGGQSFHAHRSILAACSSHFRALLSSTEGDEAAGTKVEHGDAGPCVMELDQEVVTPEAFSTLLEMIYTSTLTPCASNVMDVLLAASHLHLNTVVKACKLHLSKRDFPTSPPKGWRSVQQQPTVDLSSALPTGDLSEASSSSVQLGSLSPQPLQFSLSSCFSDDSLNCGTAGMEVSHSGGHLDAHGGVNGGANRKRNTAPPAGHKRTVPGSDDTLCGRKRLRLGEDIPDPPPAVTRSTAAHAREEPPAAGAPPPESRGEQEEAQEEKYEAAKWESEERELPSQSDGGVRGTGGGEEGPDAAGRVRVGEEKQEEEEGNVVLVEVKRENLSTSSPDPAAERSPSPDGALSDRSTAADDDPRRDTPPPPEDRGGEASEEPVLGEGLDSLSELAFSCFLNPGSESVMGALEVEESLASLTAAAAAAENIAGAPGTAGEPCETSEPIHSSGSTSSSSLVFPVATVPLQQLLSTQAPGFSDTLLLQPGPGPAGGFLGLRPAPSHASGAGRTRGGACLASPGLRRIAPKAAPLPAVSEADPGPAAPGADRPALTRASEEVLSKCKKAAAEDHVVLVEGEKKYACGICCKTFVNLTDCKKHIRVHTGEKPYPCPKCGKRFSQSSHLYKHSKNTCLHWTALADSLL